MGYYRLSSFDEVAKAYDDIKPIRGARANEDLRPLAQRRYWWNRVHKVSDNKYVLCDGHWAWSVSANEDTIREQTAPIVWERKEDGDYLTVRSHMNEGISVSRYTFLQSFLPQGMFFRWPNGKHFVAHNGKEHYLPKFKGTIDWQTKTFEMIEDNKLVFKAIGDGNFERVGDLLPMRTRRINKDVDSLYKPKMKEMWDWMLAVLPVMGDNLFEGKSAYSESITEGKGGYWYWKKYVKPELVREILNDPEHDLRMSLAVMSAFEIGAGVGGRFEPSKESYQKFRTLLRTTGNMLAVEMR